MIILPERDIPKGKFLLPQRRLDWDQPSERPSVKCIPNQTRFRLTSYLDDGAISWRGWFDDREDADAFLWAMVTGSLEQEPALWRLPSPGWYPGPIERYEFVTVTFLTNVASVVYSLPVDWSNTNSIEGIGAGSWGGGGGVSPWPAGGGGAYAKVQNLVSPDLIVQAYVQVPNIGSTYQPGQDALFNATSRSQAQTFGPTKAMCAAGGVVGSGGTVANSVGITKYDGGNSGYAAGSDGYPGWGGGGAAGPGGAGKRGGTTSITGYGGGGGSGGGGAGGGASTDGSAMGQQYSGGYGGNGPGGTGGGAGGSDPLTDSIGYAGTPGSGGGSGGGAGSNQYGNGSGNVGAMWTGGAPYGWDGTHGPGGGGGGGGGTGYVGNNGGSGGGGSTYGAGGGGNGYGTNGGQVSGPGAQGLIVVTYTPFVGITAGFNMPMMGM